MTSGCHSWSTALELKASAPRASASPPDVSTGMTASDRMPWRRNVSPAPGTSSRRVKQALPPGSSLVAISRSDDISSAALGDCGSRDHAYGEGVA